MQIHVEHLTDIELGMRPAELVLKKIYTEHPELGLDRPQPLAVVKDIMAFVVPRARRAGSPRTIPETDFFTAGRDVALVQHLRYLPVNFHRHTFFEIGCLLSGECTNYVDGRELAMVPGDICIIPPGTEHAVGVFSDETVLLNILVRSSTFESAFSSLASPPGRLANFFIHALRSLPIEPYLYARAAGDADVLGYIAKAYKEDQREGCYQRGLLNSLVTGLLITLFDKYLDGDGVAQQGDRSGALRILQYLHQNLATATLAGLADHLSYSERQVQRLLADEVGMGFTELLTSLRMEQAAELVSHSSRPVAEIAPLVGYSEVSNFRRAFKRFHGMTVGELQATGTARPGESEQLLAGL